MGCHFCPRLRDAALRESLRISGGVVICLVALEDAPACFKNQWVAICPTFFQGPKSGERPVAFLGGRMWDSPAT